MSIYLFTAEHIARNEAVQLVRKLEDLNFEVDFANMDPVFSRTMNMIVTCDAEASKVVRNHIWEVNNGASCEIEQITADQLEAYL